MNLDSDQSVVIERCTMRHLQPWSILRAALWPHHSVEEHFEELTGSLCESPGNFFGFVARLSGGDIVGFAEASLRIDYVNGCSSSPVLFLEGIYVEPAYRRQKVGKALLDAVRACGKLSGCTEFASDASLDNLESHAFHAALGFEETQRVVFFRQRL
jgi:aminoglycoside 6'-N-acetyltransferase I